MCVWVVARLPQRLKSTFSEIFSSLWVAFGDRPLENFSKNIDFSLWGKQCIFLPKWTFFCFLAHCVYTCDKWRSADSIFSQLHEYFFVIQKWSISCASRIFPLKITYLKYETNKKSTRCLNQNELLYWSFDF